MVFPLSVCFANINSPFRALMNDECGALPRTPLKNFLKKVLKNLKNFHTKIILIKSRPKSIGSELSDGFVPQKTEVCTNHTATQQIVSVLLSFAYFSFPKEK